MTNKVLFAFLFAACFKAHNFPDVSSKKDNFFDSLFVICLQSGLGSAGAATNGEELLSATRNSCWNILLNWEEKKTIVLVSRYRFFLPVNDSAVPHKQTADMSVLRTCESGEEINKTLERRKIKP